jgi:iron complex outermembrane receptor protein
VRAAALLLAACLVAAADCACAETALSLDLPAGELWPGLQRIAHESGQRILVPDGSSALAPLRHPALHGRMSVEQALDRMLEGSGFRWQRDRDGSISIVALARADATLAPLRIDGEAPGADASSAPGGWASGFVPQPGSPVATLEGARLDAVPVRSFAELLRRAPNVSGQGEGMTIRGIERGASATATSNVYLDGIPVGARVLELGALPQLERADYRRGPRAIPDGLGAMAGVIRLETVAPRPESDAHAELSWIADDGGEARADLSRALGQSGALARLALAEQRTPGRVDDPITGERDIDARQQRLLHGRLLYEPDEIESLSLRASLLSLHGDPGLSTLIPPQVGAFDPFDDLSYDPLRRTRRLRADGAALEAEWRLTARDALLAFVQGSRTSLRSDIEVSAESEERQRREERESLGETGVRWLHRFDHGWRMRLGFDQSEREGLQSEAQITPLGEFFPPSLDVEITPDTQRLLILAARHRVTTRGAFAEIGWQGDQVEATLGLRRVEERRESVRQVRARLSNDACTLSIRGGAPRPCSDEFPESETRQRIPSHDGLALPHLQFAWEPVEAQRWSLEWRRGFVAGGARLDTTSGVLAPYRPERSDTLDLGWSLDDPARRWRLGATLFFNRWYDRHVPVDLPQRDSFLTVNAGKAHAYGGEIELRWNPDERLQAWFGIGALRTRYDEFDARLPSGTVDLAGHRFPGAPSVTMSTGALWRPRPHWQFGATGWYGGAAYSDALNTEEGRRAGHAVFDFSARRALGGHAALSLALRNAFDRRYLEDVRVAGVQPRPREYLTGRRREFELSFSWDW